jgi:hypothetical protein
MDVVEGAGQEAINRIKDTEDHALDALVSDVLSRARVAREEYSRRLGQLDAALRDAQAETLATYTALAAGDDNYDRKIFETISQWVKVEQSYASQSATAANQYRMDLYSATDLMAEKLAEIL